jgi:hypothetical protein
VREFLYASADVLVCVCACLARETDTEEETEMLSMGLYENLEETKQWMENWSKAALCVCVCLSLSLYRSLSLF